MRPRMLLFVVAALLFLTLLTYSEALTFRVTLNVSKPIYRIGDQANIWGDVTLEGTMVWNALVAVQVNNPNGTPVILRTRYTQMTPAASEIDILGVTPCDANARAKNWFKRGEGNFAYFRIQLENLGTSPRYTEIAMNIYDVRNVAFEALVVFKGLLPAGITELLVSEPLSQDIPLGTAAIYVTALTALPSNGGYAYCPEKSAVFSIADSAVDPAPITEPPPTGNYTLTFLIDNYATTRNFRPGLYNVTATCKYQTFTANATVTFEVVLTGDINRDGIVDIFDAILLSGSYNAVLGEPRWNANADFNFDGIVDIYDAIILANNFGKKA
jgi:hypothetical protein